MGKSYNFDLDWRYRKGNLAPQDETSGWGGAKAKAYDFGATAKTLDDHSWNKVRLPHDFVVNGDYTRKVNEDSDMCSIPEMESIDSRHFAGGSLEGGVCWYRKHFTLKDLGVEELGERRVFIHFGGIYRNSTVYLNEYFVGTHKNGYSSFTYDITDFLDESGENVIAVRVDATGREGWWYEGGGIYRHVWIEVKEPIYVQTNGLHIWSKQIDCKRKTSTVCWEAQLFNHTLSDKTVGVKLNIYDGDNPIFTSATKEYIIPAWDEKMISGSTDLEQVKLWDIDNPYLYRFEVILTLEENNITESESVLFGIRKIEFSANKGVLLNDRYIRLQGLCCHHDHAGVGIAIPDDVWEFRLRQMKKMGANAYRSAHHQASKVVLDLCDRLGILVLDETRRMSSAPQDIEQLKNMVKTDRNHPSVFLWGIGNEEIFSQDKLETEKTTITMKMEVRKLDTTRPVTAAVVCWNGKERFDTAQNYIHVTKNLDVMGFNYCKSAWEDYHRQQPTQPIIITEASANSWTRGCYDTNEALGQYYIYDKDNERKCKSGKKAAKIDMAEEEWRYFAQRPYLSGIFLWTGIDYRGEPTPTAYPAVYSQFGIMDYCGFEKDNFYYYQSWWQPLPVLHIFPHWNYDYAQIGKNLTMYAYSNMDEVELLVNGTSYGRCSIEKNWYAKWSNVKYEPGTVTAVGYQNGEEILRREIKTTKAAKKISLQAYKDSIDRKNGVGIIKVSIEDDDGNIVPIADNMLSVKVEGGELLGTGNGNPGDHDADNTSMRRAFNGLAEVLVRPDRDNESDDVVVTVSSDGLQSSKIVLRNKN